jgi:hypothetical protein
MITNNTNNSFCYAALHTEGTNDYHAAQTKWYINEQQKRWFIQFETSIIVEILPSAVKTIIRAKPKWGMKSLPWMSFDFGCVKMRIWKQDRSDFILELLKQLHIGLLALTHHHQQQQQLLNHNSTSSTYTSTKKRKLHETFPEQALTLLRNNIRTRQDITPTLNQLVVMIGDVLR